MFQIILSPSSEARTAPLESTSVASLGSSDLPYASKALLVKLLFQLNLTVVQTQAEQLLGISAFSGNSVAIFYCTLHSVQLVVPPIPRKDVDSMVVYRTSKDLTGVSSMRGSSELLEGR